MRRIGKRRIAREKFVPAQPGQRHFQPRLFRRPRNKVRVDTIHAGLVESGKSLIHPRNDSISAQSHFAVLRLEALRRQPRELRFIERRARKRQRETLNSSPRLRRKRRDRAGVQPAR